jgi:hypothetical protein
MVYFSFLCSIRSPAGIGFREAAFFITNDRTLTSANELYFSTPCLEYGFAGPQNYINNSTKGITVPKKGRAAWPSFPAYNINLLFN